MTDAPRTRRMPASERKAEVLDAATLVFSERGWGGATTAQIAQQAAINEALVFRHFGSKKQLYMACIDASWQQIVTMCEALILAETDPRMHWRMPGRTFHAMAASAPHVIRFWARALAENTGLDDVDAHLADAMRTAHDYVADLLARSQAAGGVEPERDVRSEAWMIIAIGWLGVTMARIGAGADGEYDSVLASHRQWLTGAPD